MADPWDGLLLEWASTLGKSQKDWDQRDEGIWPAVAQAPVRTSLYRRAFKKLWSAEDAKDVVQTTLYQLAVGDTYRPSARGAIGFKVWVFGALDIESPASSSHRDTLEPKWRSMGSLRFHTIPRVMLKSPLLSSSISKGPWPNAIRFYGRFSS
jgi:hypothetical protein